MANNFLNNLDAVSAKNTTESLLNLLQLNNLLGSGNNGGGSGSGMNGGGIGGNNGPGLFGNGGGGGLTKEQLIQQSAFYQQATVGGLGRLSGGLGGIGGSGSGMQPKSGRAITNTGNLNNHYNQQQQQQQQHQQQDIFSHSSIGVGMKSMKDMSSGNDFKQTYRSHSSGSENNIIGHQNKSYRNGDAGAYTDFGEFMSRDPYFVNMQSSNNQQRQGSNNQLQSSNQAFPQIGTFSIESVTGGQQSSNNMFGNQSQDIFGGGNHSNMMNGGGHGHANNGHNGMGNAANNHYNNSNHGSNNSGNNNSGGDVSQATRETGIIEKLLQHSYGFIQCCERQARLFFHFSQFSGNIEHLKIGDPVEFEMTYDRRTGKPIASQVTKIAPEVVLSEERVTGTVTTELKSDNSTTSTGGETTTGRISYENRGECFFLPYNKDDVEGNVTLCAGDKVSFQIATNQRGNLGACHIRLENPVHPVKYRGVVCSMKESFGFIERADVVKEIFFHFSEAEGTVELRPGDDVEFIIQTRNVSNNGKEVACNITRLPPGSVIFEDIGTTIYKGQVLKPLDRANPMRHNNDPLPGRIRYRAPDHSEVEVPFGDKDQKGDFTLRHGDWVQFLLATDRRDQLQRATSISLLDETFEVSGERREQGCVAGLKEGFGFLRCVDRNVRLFFHFTEVLDTTRELCMGDEVEFTTVQDPGSNFANNRLSAIRIKHLPPGQVQFETLMEANIEGVVTREAPKSPIKSTERMEGGVITYTQANTKKTIMYFLKDCDKPPRAGDQVRFDICQVKRNKELIAVNIVDILATSNSNQSQATQNPVPEVEGEQRAITKPGSPDLNNSNGSNGVGGNGKVYDGFIAVLKETFGFIETLQHDEEVFFHFSNFVGNHLNLELGQEVEYTLSKRNGSNAGNCLPAENVKVLPRGSIAQPAVPDTIYNGIVVRPLRCINPDQSQYSGLVQYIDEAGEYGTTHEFGITSLTNKRDLLQKNDYVVFKIDAAGRAAEVTAIRQKKRANVDSIKGQFGFLDYEVDEGKKLFFHMTEVQGNSTNLYSGDCVEFSVVTNQRNGKSSACNVVKVSDSQSARPERMLTRIKILSIDESVPRVIVMRQPKGPEGIGFGLATRTPRLPGVVGE